jgi:hypothetical protein
MPDEPQGNEQQPEPAPPAPQFNVFLSHNIEPEPEPSPVNSEVSSSTEPQATVEAPVSEVHVPQIPVQNGPMTSFTPNQTADPGQNRIPEGMMPQPITPAMGSGKTKWFQTKKFIIGIVVAFLIVFVGGGSAFAYVSYYQSPQKVISDSIINAVTAKSITFTGTMNVSNSTTKVSVTINSKVANATGSFDATLNITLSGKTYSINGSVLYDGTGDLYFKVGNLTNLVSQVKGSMGIPEASTFSNAIDQLVSKIDGVWIKISSQDLKPYSTDSSKADTCVNNTLKEFRGDKSAIDQVTDLYVKNPFIVVQKNLGQANGSFGYQIEVKNSELKPFLDSLKTTKIYSELHSCDSTIVIDTSSMSTTNTTDNNNTVNLWVSTWSHQMTKLEASGTDSGTTGSMTILPKFNQSVSITAPSSSITLTQLQSYIQTLVTSMSSSSQL